MLAQLMTRKKAAPSGIKVEPALRAVAARWNFRNVQQSVSLCAHEFYAVPL